MAGMTRHPSLTTCAFVRQRKGGKKNGWRRIHGHSKRTPEPTITQTSNSHTLPLGETARLKLEAEASPVESLGVSVRVRTR